MFRTLCGALLPLLAFGQVTAQKPRTVWDGVFNATQVERGNTAYSWHCSRCHGDDLSGARGVLRGNRFLTEWREDNLRSLYSMIRSTMPPGSRSHITEAEYLDIVAFLLRANDFPTGSSELAAKDLEDILIVGKEGPGPVPDSALVTVSGCLAPGENGRWTLAKATEPVRTRNPRESSAAEQSTAAARPAGSHAYGLLDSVHFPNELREGRWMEAKGFLIRSPGNDRINLTWLKGLRETCE